MKLLQSGALRRRPGAIYRIKTRGAFGPRTGYVGKTFQRPENRIAQHRRTQPWSDLIVSWDILWQSKRVTPFGLWWREIWYIVTRAPIYNYQWNRWNPRRVPIYRAAALRSERQHYRGGRMWLPGRERT